MSNELLIMNKNERRILIGYLVIAFAMMISLVFLQSYKYDIFGSRLLLGWDSPTYAWLAKYVITKGAIHMSFAWGYPYFYTQLLAFFGYLTGNVVLVERILPMVFCSFLIFANSKLVLRITKNVYIAGLGAFLSAISINIIRLLSDLHSNLMAFSLSFLVLLWIPNALDRRSFLNRRYLSLIVLLLVIAGTHFETYFVLSLALVLYGFLIKDSKKILMLTLACAVPIVILALMFPSYFFGYLGTKVLFQRELPFSDILMWIGGSWPLLAFLSIAVISFYTSKLFRDETALLVFSWNFAILIIAIPIGLGVVPLPLEFVNRTLILLPVPILLALAVSGCNDFIKNFYSKCEKSIAGARIQESIRKLLLFIVALYLLFGSALVTYQTCDRFLNPHIPESGYEKILAIENLFEQNNLPPPVIVFYGYPPVNHVFLYRNYIGAEIGEHFAYWGKVENLFKLQTSEPIINDDYSSQLERYYSTVFFEELLGNFSGPPPPMYVHDSYITNVTALMAHPIVIITPEFYNQEIPYYIKPFYISDGIYVISPNAINLCEIR